MSDGSETARVVTDEGEPSERGLLSEGPAPSGAAAPPPGWAPPVEPEGPRVHWLGAIAWGLLMAVFLGTIWGLVLLYTGYVFWLLALALGLAIAWALLHGGCPAGRRGRRSGRRRALGQEAPF